jgi:hypothetical protein
MYNDKCLIWQHSLLISAGNVIAFPSARGAHIVKMASIQEKSFWMNLYAKINSVTNMQREVRKRYQKNPVKESQVSTNSLKPRGAFTAETVKMEPVRSWVQDKRVTCDSWGSNWVPLKYVWNLERVSISLHILSEHYVANLISIFV